MTKTLHGLIALMAISLATMFFHSCTDYSEPETPTAADKNIGVIHNEMLAAICGQLPNLSTRSDKMTKQEIKNIWINQATEKALKDNPDLDHVTIRKQIEETNSITLDQIKQQMTSEQVQVLTIVKKMLVSAKDLKDINEYIRNTTLTEKEMEATIAFSDVYVSSSSYWASQGNAWVKYINDNLSTTEAIRKLDFSKVDWDLVVFTDAYYGWSATISTGGNLMVGGCIAGVASAMAILSQAG